MSVQETNKQIALDFIEIGFNQGRPAEAVERYVGATYTQHNPILADGIDGFLAFATGFAEAFPDLSIAPRRVVAEGDLVFVHSVLTGVAMPGDEPSDDLAYALIDVMRVEDGKIREHWDVIQRIPAESQHGNPVV